MCQEVLQNVALLHPMSTASSTGTLVPPGMKSSIEGTSTL